MTDVYIVNAVVDKNGTGHHGLGGGVFNLDLKDPTQLNREEIRMIRDHLQELTNAQYEGEFGVIILNWKILSDLDDRAGHMPNFSLLGL